MLLITPGFPANEADDTCIPPLQLLVRRLCSRGVPVQVIALEYPFRSDPYKWYGAAVYPCNGGNRKWLRSRTQIRAHRYARQLINTGKITTLHSFWLGHAWHIGGQLCKLYGLPHSTTLMGQDVLMSVNGRYLRRVTAADAAHLVALSDFHAEQFLENTGFPVRKMIPWGIDTSDFNDLQPLEQETDILGAGSLLPVKNHEMWVRVISVVVRQHPGLRAVLAGDGPEMPKINRLIHQFGLSGNIRLTGNIPRSEVLRLMASSKVLLHTSRFESYGYVLAEAAAAGCRVVSTPVGIGSRVGQTAVDETGLAELVMKGLVAEGRLIKIPFLMEDTAEAYL